MILKWDVAGGLLEYDIVFNVGRSKTVALLCNVLLLLFWGFVGIFRDFFLGFFLVCRLGCKMQSAFPYLSTSIGSFSVVRMQFIIV